MSGSGERLDALAERLDAIAEEIAEAAIEELKSALQRGDGKRPATERTLTQARRAAEKSAHLLRQLGDGRAGADPFDDDVG